MLSSSSYDERGDADFADLLFEEFFFVESVADGVDAVLVVAAVRSHLGREGLASDWGDFEGFVEVAARSSSLLLLLRPGSSDHLVLKKRRLTSAAG